MLFKGQFCNRKGSLLERREEGKVIGEVKLTGCAKLLLIFKRSLRRNTRTRAHLASVGTESYFDMMLQTETNSTGKGQLFPSEGFTEEVTGEPADCQAKRDSLRRRLRTPKRLGNLPES